MLSVFSLLSETVATVSLSAPPTVAHIRRWAVNTMPAVGQTMQFGDNYLNDGHFPPEMPGIDGRESMWQPSLAVSFEVHDAAEMTYVVVRPAPHDHLDVVVVCGGWLQREQGGSMQSGQSTHKTMPCLVRLLWLVTRNSAENDRRCINYRRAGERLAASTATAVCGVCGPWRLAWIYMCGSFSSVPAGTNLCSYWFGLGTAAVGSFDLY